ncbi:MAG: gamma-glutamylcyclotransferase family protein [Xenococcaceae cyanobacterium MO_207.B15]|nr:gamma-glutamylcyclotransferase family protein [Xenococcaceae cyanobacterium MO_207.B15]
MYEANFVFGYGSLMNVENLQKYLGRDLTPVSDFIFCGLRDFHRCWNIAMDNRMDLPDYKYYIDAKTGNRPEGFVTFLNIRPYKTKTITGILFRVSHEELDNLDRRERNYQRIDVTHQINTPIRGKAWVYQGLDQAEQRYQKGLEQNNAMIAQDYFDSVHNAYFLLGKKAFSHYAETTDKPRVPILNLKMSKTISILK